MKSVNNQRFFKGIWSVLYFSDIRTSTHIWAHKQCRYIKTQIDKNWRILRRLKNVIASVHEEPFGKSTPYLSWIRIRELQNSRKMPSTGDIHLFFNNNLQDMLASMIVPLIHLPDILFKKKKKYIRYTHEGSGEFGTSP